MRTSMVSWKVLTAGVVALGLTAGGAVSAVAASSDADAGDATRAVIVVLKDQIPSAPADKASAGERATRVASQQAPLEARVRASGGAVSHSFKTLNGFSATMSGDQAAKLADDPAVARVIPDAIIPAPAPAVERAKGATPSFAPGTTLAQAAAQGICPADPAQPLLEPEALQSTKATQANAIADGTGVKVAFVADGLDIQNPDLERDGQSIFTDYKDFSGDGTAAPTTAAEAFGDASAIAAQGNETYDLHDDANAALPQGCNIRIKGVAPGASLVGIKVFPLGAGAPTSTIVAGADYAVSVDHVDVLNYSLGGNPIPDLAASDALKLFNEQAVAAGVTVTISSGDAGPRNSIGSPAGEPGILTLGASTNFRNYLQTGYGGTTLPQVTTWKSDQFSQISSGGFTQNGRVVDLLAPGEDGWAVCSADQELYEECGTLAGDPSPIQSFGGTSQSAPLAAGGAAVVIDAYRRAHGGASPSPELVKRLLTGSADDLGLPAREQGAGLMDVQAAARAASTAATAGVVTSPTQLDVDGASGSTSTQSVTVSNASSATQTVAASVRELGAPTPLTSGTVSLDADAPTFPDLTGSRPRRYRLATFTVPAGADRLDTRITWQDPTAGVRLALIGPDGAYTAFSRPQGVSDFGEASVRAPQAGTWTAAIFTTADPALAAQPGFVGPVAYSASTSQFRRNAATVTPASLTLAPGASQAVQVAVAQPASPGDSDQELVLSSSGDGRSTVVPIVRRSLIGVTDAGAHFSGTLTAGNGRNVPLGELDTLAFDVPAGKPALNVDLDLGTDAEQVSAFLVDPQGQLVSTASNQATDKDAATSLTPGISVSHAAPQAGRWRLELLELSPGSGATYDLPYTGTVDFAAPTVDAAAVPNDAATRLPAGKAQTFSLRVRNGGLGTRALFLDPRTTTRSDQRLVSDAPEAATPVLGAAFDYVVPPGTDHLAASLQATQPVSFDLITLLGNPDVIPANPGLAPTATFSAPDVAPGIWSLAPTALGPFGDAPAPDGTVTSASLTAHTLGFDRTVATSTGDPFLGAVDPKGGEDTFPVTLAPGRTGDLDVTITPKGDDGDVVAGTVYVDTYDPFTGSGDVLAAVPYRYTIGTPAATTPGGTTPTTTTPGTPTTPGTTTTVTTPAPAPTPAPGSPPAGAPATPQAALGALLGSPLERTGRLSIRDLVRFRAATELFSAPGPGVLRIRWRTTGRHAVTLATATRTFTKASTAPEKVRVKLTKAGLAKLRSARRITFVEGVAFTPVGGRTTGASVTRHLKRG